MPKASVGLVCVLGFLFTSTLALAGPPAKIKISCGTGVTATATVRYCSTTNGGCPNPAVPTCTASCISNKFQTVTCPTPSFRNFVFVEAFSCTTPSGSFGNVGGGALPFASTCPVTGTPNATLTAK